jgi:competence protein ComEC
MLAVALALLYRGRRGQPGAALGLAAAVVLLSDPLAILDAGFWLSFGVVACLLLACVGQRAAPWWESFLRVQWVAGMAVLPLLVFWFGQAPLNSPLANMLAVPVFSLLVVPLGLTGVALLELWPALAVRLLLLAERVLAWLWPLLERFAG